MLIKVEKMVGFVDVKTSPVQFYVQRNSSFSKVGSVITWDLARLNIGGAMNLTSGVFTAPRDGVYHFHISGYAYTYSFDVFLRVNGERLASFFAFFNQDAASLQSTLQLKSGDRVDYYLWSGSFYDNQYHWTHLNGWLDEEDLQL